jgi:hypothetical protein
VAAAFAWEERPRARPARCSLCLDAAAPRGRDDPAVFSAVGWICVQEAVYRDEYGDRQSHPRQPTLDAVAALLDRLVPPTFVVPERRPNLADVRSLLPSRMKGAQQSTHDPLPGPEAMFRADNGTWTVLIDTHRNHRRTWPEDLFREVARVAPGSFGFLHIWDDEHPTESQKFMRWSMVLGNVAVAEDKSLRPVMRLMWDAYDSE